MEILANLLDILLIITTILGCIFLGSIILFLVISGQTVRLLTKGRLTNVKTKRTKFG